MEGQGPTLSVGPVLRDSLILVLRHWVLLVIGTAVLAEVALLNMSLLGRCFADSLPACPSSITTLGDRGEWLIYSATHEITGFVVAAVAIYFLYSSTQIEVPEFAGLRRSRARSWRLFGRLGLIWVVILLPIYAFDIGWSEIFRMFPSLADSEAIRWLMYVVRTITVVAFSGYLHARLVLYLPTAAYSSQPETWRESWNRSGAHGGRLFTVFFIIGFALSVAQLGIVMLAYRAPGYLGAVDFISGLLGVRSNYLLRNLGQELPYVILGLPGTLLEAAASLVAFKILMPAADTSAADIFS